MTKQKIGFDVNKKQLKKASARMGGRPSLARALGVSPMAIYQWEKRGSMPVPRAMQIEQVTEGYVTRADLFPDLFDAPE